jgi:hypothetical protein
MSVTTTIYSEVFAEGLWAATDKPITRAGQETHMQALAAPSRDREICFMSDSPGSSRANLEA